MEKDKVEYHRINLGKVYCKDCKYSEIWIEGYGGCRHQEAACGNPVNFETIYDPVDGPIEQRISDCAGLNRDCDCQYFEQKEIKTKKKWWRIFC